MAKIYSDYSLINAFVTAGLPVIAAMSSVTALLSNPAWIWTKLGWANVWNNLIIQAVVWIYFSETNIFLF